MQHSIEDLIQRINVMKDKAIQVHRLRNQYSNLTEKLMIRRYATCCWMIYKR
jgi:hypothetical protein